VIGATVMFAAMAAFWFPAAYFAEWYYQPKPNWDAAQRVGTMFTMIFGTMGGPIAGLAGLVRGWCSWRERYPQDKNILVRCVEVLRYAPPEN
jgi:hypothetical protein